MQYHFLTSSVLNPRSPELWRRMAREKELWASAGLSQCGGLRAKGHVYWGFLWSRKSAENVERGRAGGGSGTGIQRSPLFEGCMAGEPHPCESAVGCRTSAADLFSREAPAEIRLSPLLQDLPAHDVEHWFGSAGQWLGDDEGQVALSMSISDTLGGRCHATEQRDSIVARAATNLLRIVAIEFGTWRSGRNGGSSGLVTFA